VWSRHPFEATPIAEDLRWARTVLLNGHALAYVADAVVEHSHAHSLAGAFRRQFDIGYARRLHAHLLLARERDEVRGRRFAAAVLRLAREEAPARLPRVTAELAASWLGYRVGLLGPRLPWALARRLSGQDYYWTSEAAPGGSAALAPV
jgi:rhamnosyltransferase